MFLSYSESDSFTAPLGTDNVLAIDKIYQICDAWDIVTEGIVWIRRLWLALGDMRQRQFRAKLSSR